MMQFVDVIIAWADHDGSAGVVRVYLAGNVWLTDLATLVHRLAPKPSETTLSIKARIEWSLSDEFVWRSFP